MTTPPRGDSAPAERELLVLRHAKASRSAPVSSDFDRPLTRRGRRDAPRIAHWMRTHDLVPDSLVASPARRTRETAELLLDELGLAAEAARWDERLYDADLHAILHVIADTPLTARRLLLVGHNPGLEFLVRELGGPDVPEPRNGKLFPTCALARLRVDASWRELSAERAALLLIVSWSRKKRRWKIRDNDG